MPPALMPAEPWRSGATTDVAGALTAGPARRDSCTYLPDFCAPVAVLGIVVVAELVAIALSLARGSHWGAFFADLGGTSFVLQWLSLTSAAVLCGLRPIVSRMRLRRGSALLFAAVCVNVVLLSEAMYWIGYVVAPDVAANGWLPADHLFFATRNLAIGAVATGVLLRYFYVSGQWQQNVRREAESRLHALQARIRPHFFFNSMNTIASLVRSNPAAAEQAVEDLADLFRASLADERRRIPLAEELEIARLYERMERQRLGARLAVSWQLDAVPADATLPGLTIQPLLENAIYHGIERLAGPGEVRVEGARDGERICITITNPLPASDAAGRAGNRMALENVAERLQLAFGRGARLDVAPEPGRFRVSIVFPYQPARR